ncbi:hypothetical protein GCM10027569_21900 [Flindersiella endophytica]
MAAGLRVEVDDRSESLGARIRVARERRAPYVAVIGEREAAVDAVAVRLRGGRRLQPMSSERFLSGVAAAVSSRRREVDL